jgi:hypothetical protein
LDRKLQEKGIRPAHDGGFCIKDWSFNVALRLYTASTSRELRKVTIHHFSPRTFISFHALPNPRSQPLAQVRIALSMTLVAPFRPKLQGTA